MTNPKRFTIDDVRKVLTDGHEDDLPDRVLAILREHEGKALARMNLGKLPPGPGGPGDTWRLRTVASMTHLETKSYMDKALDIVGVSLLMAYETKGVTINTAFVVQHNPGYFDARVKRNEARDAAARHDAVCQRMADALTAYADARAALDAAQEQLDALTEHGAPFHADAYTFKALVETKRAQE